jgi:hypothetical protein
MNCPENCGCKVQIQTNKEAIKTIGNRIWQVGILTILNLLAALGYLAGVFLSGKN